MALECPLKDETIPLCPTSGSTLLDDTYPVQAFVISNRAAGQKTTSSLNVPIDFIETISDSYSENHYQNVPQMIYSAGNEIDLDNLKVDLRKRLKNKKIPDSDIDKVINQISFRAAASYTWQQDYFESFFDPNTGSPVLRKVGDYDSKMRQDTGKIEDMAKVGQACGITSGSELKGDPKSTSINAEMGGNIEGAPGGFCLVGDNQGNDYTKSFCKSDDNIIRLQTSWLTVGHVDELFKIIPTHIDDGRPKECQFSLMAASPKKAIELMKSPKYGKENIFDYDPKLSDEEINQYLSNKPSSKTANGMCKYIKEIIKDKNNSSPKSIDSSSRSVFLNGLSLIISNSFAGVVRPKTEPQKNLCLEGMKNTSNYDLASKMIEDDNFNKLNNTIQDSIDRDKAQIKEKILSRLPQCSTYFDKSILDVPNIFSSPVDPTVINSDTNKLELKKNAYNTNSIYPNPSNSVVMNKTILFPNPENKAFSGYLSEEMKKRGLIYKSVNTWDYAHVGDGNIHCSSHTLNHCRANK